MESKEAIVKSVVKVAIPALFHPNVPFYILLLQDEFGNTWGQKSEKEYSIGDRYQCSAVLNKKAVAVWRIKYDIGEAIEKATGLLGGVVVDKNSKILILPTVSMPSYAYFKDNTSPEFLEAVVEFLIGKGADKANISIASQSFGSVPAGAIAQKSGLVEASLKFGITPLDLSGGSFENKDGLEVSSNALSADLIINLAMEKMDQASACDNLAKILSKKSFDEQKSSGASLAEKLESILGKVMVIGEADFVQKNNKTTTFMGLIMASQSGRSLDRVFNEVSQSFNLPETIKDINVNDIPIAGRTIKEVQYQAEFL